MNVICDTDVMVDYWDMRHPRHRSTITIIHDEIGIENVTLSAITRMELLKGSANKSEMALITKRLNKYDTLLLNNEITLKAFDLLQEYYPSHSLQIPDALIAATAMVSGLELFTYNVKDYRYIKGLKLFRVFP